jgi:hypothetical protein
MDFRKSVKELIADLHGALQEAVEDYGGTVALAAKMGKGHGEISLRVRREEDSHGQIQKAHLDLVAYVVEDRKARMRFINGLLKRWGCKPAELMREPTPEEKLRLILARLDGASGEAILKDAAESAGYDSAIFRR